MEITPRQFNEIKSLLLDIQEEMSKIYQRIDEKKEKEMLTPNEVCRILKIGRSTYQRYVEAGIIHQIHIGSNNNRVYVKRSEFERLIDEGRI